MTRTEIQTTVLRLLGNVAPEVDLPRLLPNVSFRDQIDIDSMDLLNFVIALHREFNVEIPERDYPKLATIEGCVSYLEQSLHSKK